MKRDLQASRGRQAPPLPLPAMTNPHKGRTGLDRFIRATGHSINGMQLAYRHESAFRAELGVAAVLLVLIVELLNSAIEAAIDRVSYELHDLSKRAKDIASAAVFLALLLCAGIWGAALWHRVQG